MFFRKPLIVAYSKKTYRIMDFLPIFGMLQYYLSILLALHEKLVNNLLHVDVNQKYMIVS